MFTVFDAVLVLAATYTLTAACWDAYLHTAPASLRHPKLHLSTGGAALVVVVLAHGSAALIVPFAVTATWYLVQLGSDLRAASRTLRRKKVSRGAA